MPWANPSNCETSACPRAAVTGRRRCQKCIDAKKLHKNRVDYQQYKNRPKDAEARKIYTSALWRKSRINFLAHSPWCVECGKEGVMTVATDLDHKVSIADGCDPWDAENWQGLCKRHHSEKTASETLHRKSIK